MFGMRRGRTMPLRCLPGADASSGASCQSVCRPVVPVPGGSEPIRTAVIPVPGGGSEPIRTAVVPVPGGGSEPIRTAVIPVPGGGSNSIRAAVVPASSTCACGCGASTDASADASAETIHSACK